MFRRLSAAVHRQLQVTATLGHRRTAAAPAASRSHFLGFVRPYSVSSVAADDPSSLIASSLTRSCGISDHAALSISKKVQPDALDKALSVLAVLKDYGFEEAHLVRLVDRYPRSLLMDVEKTLKPKLEFYCGISLVGTALPEIVSASPRLLTASLEKRLIPNAETAVLPKFDALRAYGVPDDVILVLLARYGYALVTDTDRFNDAFDEVKKMGICPKKPTFAHALGVLAIFPKKKWLEKVENLRELGWSQSHILEAFAKFPYIVRASTEKIRKTAKFVEEKLGWTPEHTVKNPSVLSLSLEKRLMPRESFPDFGQELPVPNLLARSHQGQGGRQRQSSCGRQQARGGAAEAENIGLDREGVVRDKLRGHVAVGAGDTGMEVGMVLWELTCHAEVDDLGHPPC
ncbi:hypothetical protein ZIOFF_009157 [Zingiber officinale]|uniref:Mitochondrial transcription termination factor family protein n=1 Tax=Zingiber officinale TaxID=94328 RepID=A0A8J5HF73_ZINOF|nr:hypothetical protein ZIOFF_009157 [Zingiber officinale]